MRGNGLADCGYRFIKRGDSFLWVHRNEMAVDDTDCTEMDDDAFELMASPNSGDQPRAGSAATPKEKNNL